MSTNISVNIQRVTHTHTHTHTHTQSVSRNNLELVVMPKNILNEVSSYK